jgi:hypothetical protein
VPVVAKNLFDYYFGSIDCLGCITEPRVDSLLITTLLTFILSII